VPFALLMRPWWSATSLYFKDFDLGLVVASWTRLCVGTGFAVVKVDWPRVLSICLNC
jgi:hypothetical protein